MAVRLAALKCTVAFLLELDESMRQQTVPLIPVMFQTLAAAFSNGDEDVVSDSCKTLTDLAEAHPKFLRQHLNLVVQTMVQIASSATLDVDTRSTAASFLLKLAEEGKGMIRSMELFPQTIIPMAFKFLCVVDHDEDEWRTAEEVDYIETEGLSMGIQCIDRLALALGGKIFLSIAVPIIRQFIKSNNWIHRHAALIAVAEMSDACRKEVQPSLQSIYNMVLPFTVQDPHPRVRWAATHALANFAEYFSPELQEEHHSTLMPALIACTDPTRQGAHRRVLRHATLVVVGVVAPPNMESETLEPYLEQLVKNMVALLKSNDMGLQESALMCIAAMASVAGMSFGKYYDFFMTTLVQIIKTAVGEDKRSLRAAAIECIGMFGQTVDTAKFTPHARSIVEELVRLQNSGIGNEDPQWFQLEQTLVRIAKVLRGGFKPYLQVVVSHLVEKARQEDGCSFLAQDESVGDGMQEVVYQVRGHGNARVQFNSTALEEKGIACNLLYEYARDMREDFHECLLPVFQTVLELVTYKWNDITRIACAAAIPACLAVSRAYADSVANNNNNNNNNNNTNNNNSTNNKPNYTELQQMWALALPQLVKAARIEPRLELTNAMLHGIGECVETLAFPLTREQMDMVSDTVLMFLKQMYDRIQERNKIRNDPDFDERDAEVIEEENEMEYEHLGYIAHLLRQVFQKSGDAFLDIYNAKLANVFMNMLNPQRDIHEQVAGFSVLDDVVMFGGPRAAKQYLGQLLKLSFAHVAHADDDMRRAAFYGLGVCAEAGGSEFEQFAQRALGVLVQSVNAKGAREGDQEEVTDNAISSIVRIISKHQNVAPLDKMLTMVLNWMPVSKDEIEAHYVHKWLVQLIQSGHSAVMGNNNANLPVIVGFFSDVLNTDLIDDDTSKAMIAATHALQQKYGSEFQAAYQKLNQAQQQNLQTAINNSSNNNNNNNSMSEVGKLRGVEYYRAFQSSNHDFVRSLRDLIVSKRPRKFCCQMNGELAVVVQEKLREGGFFPSGRVEDPQPSWLCVCPKHNQEWNEQLKRVCDVAGVGVTVKMDGQALDGKDGYFLLDYDSTHGPMCMLSLHVSRADGSSREVATMPVRFAVSTRHGTNSRSSNALVSFCSRQVPQLFAIVRLPDDVSLCVVINCQLPERKSLQCLLGLDLSWASSRLVPVLRCNKNCKYTITTKVFHDSVEVKINDRTWSSYADWFNNTQHFVTPGVASSSSSSSLVSSSSLLSPSSLVSSSSSASSASSASAPTSSSLVPSSSLASSSSSSSLASSSAAPASASSPSSPSSSYSSYSAASPSLSYSSYSAASPYSSYSPSSSSSSSLVSSSSSASSASSASAPTSSSLASSPSSPSGEQMPNDLRGMYKDGQGLEKMEIVNATTREEAYDDATNTTTLSAHTTHAPQDNGSPVLLCGPPAPLSPLPDDDSAFLPPSKRSPPASLSQQREDDGERKSASSRADPMVLFCPPVDTSPDTSSQENDEKSRNKLKDQDAEDTDQPSDGSRQTVGQSNENVAGGQAMHGVAPPMQLTATNKRKAEAISASDDGEPDGHDSKRRRR
eukprot:TRINITY_DN65842_c6_g5_i7.p1 TRINITY_DN65842_c6_g5~~TRINITY_DN65842_c6_g5_i7.p1  ORF type:complete len:1775 (-),score=941.62 TRINITY_DN65842_c6_g5_i7:68-4741(-)